MESKTEDKTEDETEDDVLIIARKKKDLQILKNYYIIHL